MTLPLDIHTHHQPAVPGSAIVNRYPDTFSIEDEGCFSVGIHPWYLPPSSERKVCDNPVSTTVAGEAAAEAHPSLARVKALLETAVHRPQVLAVGEAGLDRLSSAPMPWQMELFTYQARLAQSVGKPLVIHLVKAVDELLLLHRQLRPANPWIIHGFRGNPTLANSLLRQGLYLSFGEHYREETLQAVPLDRLLIETDESVIPLDTLYERAARLRRLPVEAFRQSVGENVRRLFFKS